ncbi:ligase-associated DNA damage response endonuclease PdeM [Limnovirga soli]|uniref:Ligase-associated DNA damage response endonuclease PdeM n=1 Tax=Limnovirga soli TaxID=2656915 RepID=A0A8J8JQF7_9BACT|nr:ligase-associated DNA damage response endonuclease PdeM [Limnovirga soli]NNV54677.1 ligase-associated DNA damage response endonuclease PdeM [Limnovirga soli]
MQAPVSINIQSQTCWLTAQRTLFWEEEQSLILSDLHFGKTGHFRKSGIAVPTSVFVEDLQRLFAQIQYFKPTRLIIVGDMFHSHQNQEIAHFVKWRNDIGHIQIQLVKGNHDILKDTFYHNSGIEVHESIQGIKGFGFVHDPAQISNEDSYMFTGHIHPGVRIKTGSRQTLSFPCFYFGVQYAILPAFSMFTGYVNIKPKAADTVYAIVNNTLVKV